MSLGLLYCFGMSNLEYQRLRFKLWRYRNGPFIQAVEKGKTGEVHRLLDNGANVNSCARSENALAIAGRSPWSNADVVRLLLERGANIEGKPALVYPLLRASHQSDHERIWLLIEAGSDLSRMKGGRGITTLSELCTWAELETIQLAVAHGADVRQRNWLPFQSNTALHVAACCPSQNAASLDIVKFLVSQGAEVKARDDLGRTPRDMAQEHLDHPYHRKRQASPEMKRVREVIAWLKFVE